MKEANNLSLDEYRKRSAEFDEKAAIHFKDALPYFEKAVEVNTDDELQLLETLQGVYYKLNMKAEGDALDAKIKAISGM